MTEDQKYRVGTVAKGPMFDQGKRWTVVGPGNTVLGYHETEEGAAQQAETLNRPVRRSSVIKTTDRKGRTRLGNNPKR